MRLFIYDFLYINNVINPAIYNLRVYLIKYNIFTLKFREIYIIFWINKNYYNLDIGIKYMNKKNKK